MHGGNRRSVDLSRFVEVISNHIASGGELLRGISEARRFGSSEAGMDMIFRSAEDVVTVAFLQ